jgi:ice-binding like protein
MVTLMAYVRTLRPRAVCLWLVMFLVASAAAACGSRDANGPLTPVSLTISPNPKTLQIGQSQQFTVTGTNSDGDEISVSPTWSVIHGGGTISESTGSFTAGLDIGTFTNTVRATSGSVSTEATVTVIADPVAGPVLKSVAANGIMAGQSFTCVTNGTINANISISPGSTVTGFPPCVITGVQHLADAPALQAQVDLTAAYDSLMGLPCPGGNLITTDIGTTTKAPGVYCSASGIGVTGALTLDAGNDTSATFVFQAGSTLITAGNVVLINGAKAGNVYWVVGSSATLGTGSQWQGNIIALTSITLVDNATLIGRALARNGSVSLGTNNTITLP